MSKDRFYGTVLDGLYKTTAARSPKFAFYIWNPNRTTINDVVLDRSESPRYDITPWVVRFTYKDNLVFESESDSVASNVQITLYYDQDATPIPITEKTLLDKTPIQIRQGDARVPEEDWIPIFTGFLQGNPAVSEEARPPKSVQEISVIAVDRAAAFLNTVVTAFSYEQNEDIGRAAVETSIQFMGLDRREVKIGKQDYLIGHEQTQLVDMEVMSGIYLMLFCVGKKPKFDNEGFLVAADNDFDKPPARVHKDKSLIMNITRSQVNQSANNSVRIKGLSNILSKVVEQEKRLAHGNMTSGFFDRKVDHKVHFSEGADKAQGGRKAINTKKGKIKIGKMGGITFGENFSWSPFFEDDGETVIGGKIEFETGGVADFRTGLMAAYIAFKGTDVGLKLAGITNSVVLAIVLVALSITELTILLALFQSLATIGRVDWEIVGQPVHFVFEEILATGQLANLLSADIREKEIENHWIYDIDVAQQRAKEVLTRELVKAWAYQIDMVDDPILDVDDVLQIESRKYYITSIRKQFDRKGNPDGSMRLTSWRIK
jgi:hypothetical protein